VSIPVGKIVVHQGCVNAAADQFKVEIFGSNSHAARPHQGIDAIVAGSQFVIAIQQIISREIDPAQPAVITVGEFKSGTAPNVLSGYAFLSGTVRTIDPDIRNQVKAAMKRIAKSTESLYRVRIDLGFIVETPAVINDSKFCFLVKKAVSKMGEHFEAISLSALNMGAEDFSSYLNHFKGGFVRFGARYESNDFTSGAQHSSKFAFDERVIMIGANFYLRLIEQIFSQD
jgi:amidohydrolase